MTIAIVPDEGDVTRRVTEHIELVPIVARQVRRQLGGALDVDELESMAREGLLAAARTFDPSRGVPFRRWANLRVKGAIFDGLRAHGGLPRRVYQRVRALEAASNVGEALVEEDAAAPPAGAEAADARVGANLATMATAMAAAFLAARSDGLEEVEDEERASPEEATARKELLEHVRRAIAARPEAERRLLERHYFDGLTLDEAGRELGLSKSWASRLHARAIADLTAELRSRG